MDPHGPEGGGRCVRERVRRTGHHGVRLQHRACHPPGCGRLYLRRGIFADEFTGRSARLSPREAPVPGAERCLGVSDDHQQCGNHCERSGDPPSRLGSVQQDRASASSGPDPCRRQRPCEQARSLRASHGTLADGNHRELCGRSAGEQEDQSGDSGRIIHDDPARRPDRGSHHGCRWTEGRRFLRGDGGNDRHGRGHGLDTRHHENYGVLSP